MNLWRNVIADNDHVLARFEQGDHVFQHRLRLAECHRAIDHHIGVKFENVGVAVSGLHPRDWRQVGKLTGILVDLVRVVHPQPDQFQIGMADDFLQAPAAH